MCLGIPGKIVEISDVAQLRVKVDVEGVRREVSVALIGLDGPDPARVGDWVLVHVGFAMAKIDETEARETLDALKALGEMYEQELQDYSADIEGLESDNAPPSPAATPAPLHPALVGGQS